MNTEWCPSCSGIGESFPGVTCKRCKGYGVIDPKRIQITSDDYNDLTSFRLMLTGARVALDAYDLTNNREWSLDVALQWESLVREVLDMDEGPAPDQYEYRKMLVDQIYEVSDETENS